MRPKWFNLIHACRRWRHIVFVSSTHLDLCLFVSNMNPRNIQTIFSPHLSLVPVSIEYNCCQDSHMNAKTFRCMLAPLEHCNHMSEIYFLGRGPDFDELFKVTNCPFPILQILNLELCPDLRIALLGLELELPATFLKGSAPNLHHLTLACTSLTSTSSISSSAKMLIELHLKICTSFSTESLLASLHGMHCLCHLELDLQVWKAPNSINGPMPPMNPGDTFLLSKLTFFRYEGGLLWD